MEMTITRALAELKHLDKRINKAINNLDVVAANKKSATNVRNLIAKDSYQENAKSDYQSTVSLIERRKTIKSAIVESNATTKVIIADIEYTVASAIERKTSIIYDQELLVKLRRLYNSEVSRMNTENDRVSQQIDRLTEQMAGSKEQAKNLSIDNSLIDNYRNTNEYELVDPLKVSTVIDKLEREIDEFLMNVDFVLSESNTITKIEV